MQDSGPSVERGYAAQKRGDLVEAERIYRSILRRQPNHSGALNALGTLASAKGAERTAETLFRRALGVSARNWDARGNLVSLLILAGRLDEADKILEPVLLAADAPAEIHARIGSLRTKQRRHGEAIAAFRKAVQAAPSNIGLLVDCIAAKRHVCDWSDFDSDESAVRAFARQGHLVPALTLMSLSATLDEQLIAARQWADLSASKAGKSEAAGPARTPGSEQGRIGVGYLSSDFHDHATSRLLCEVIERHDRTRFRIVGYSYGAPSAGTMRERLATAFDAFHDVHHHSSAQIARRIGRDGIDILIDLKGYTAGARTDILALRPAPVQVNYLGFPGTMGAAFIDYIIADPVVGPRRFQPFSAESIVQLPDCFQPNDTKREIADPPSRRACGLPERAFVFASFANPYKVTPEFFATWMRLLRSVPGSVLWLMPKSTTCADNLRAAAGRAGIDAERLVFARPMPQPDHLARSRLADLFLDTLPVSAFTTASDAMWVGAPLVTCRGRTPAGRGGASVLTAMRLPELIADTVRDYEDLARALALDPPRLARIRSTIGRQIGAGPLFDVAAYTRNLERAYAEMHRRACAGEPATPFRIAPEAEGAGVSADLLDDS